jgi:hypothetical protein
MKKLILTTCLTALLSTNAQANYFNDGNKLLSDMEDNANTSKMYALGYIAGVVDSMNQIVFCLPSTVTVGQLNDMIRNYLRNTPAERHLPADVIIVKAFGVAFPCKKGGGV